MKIGILTFINTVNFGATLQAYALQETIKFLGFDAEIIQYSNKTIENKEKNLGLKKLSPKGVLKEVVMGNALKRKVTAFQKYEAKNLYVGMKLDNSRTAEVNSYYDKFITGSDQVWNMSIIHEDWTYFLDFVIDKAKIVSYAPSFGNAVFPKNDYNKATELLNRFQVLSVREVSGQTLIKKLTNRHAEVVVDPTLLLSRNDWVERTTFKPDLQHYILVYFPHNKKKVFAFVDKLKSKTGLPVVYLSISPKIQFGVRTICDASPDEFIGWITHADYVVTGSFHGTAFSLNMGKQFFYEPSGEGSRIENIVELCGVKNHSIADGNLDEAIDYSVVGAKLDELREKSKQWLQSALSN